MTIATKKVKEGWKVTAFQGKYSVTRIAKVKSEAFSIAVRSLWAVLFYEFAE